MSKPSLRVFQPVISDDRKERELERISGTAEPRTVSIGLGQIVPLLIDAANNDRAWLSDFADDTVRIDADLYEVLLAYQRLQSRRVA
ncbi:hypothetical protein N9D23_06650 [Rubripirellula sp.]|jgi:hypothetical protein|nr:hypothetical protein [Planctomycetaceae bacterium]MDA9857781.1 hypothetical protein [Rubripirellula sp.]